MNTYDKVQVLQRQCNGLAEAVIAMNERIEQLEHLRQPLVTRVWCNINGLWKRIIG